LYNTNKQLKNSYNEDIEFLKSHPITKTDTVYTTKIKEVTPPVFKNTVTPKTLTIYQNQINPVGCSSSTEVVPKEDSATDLVVGTNINQSAFSSTDNIPGSQQQILGFLLNRNKLSVTQYNDSITFSQEYQISPQEYKYSFYQGKLTAEKISSTSKVKFQPYAEAFYRPINNFWDLNAGLELQFKSMVYSIHLNTFYYPRHDAQGFDVGIGLRYNF
jgi:hypothetical protein